MINKRGPADSVFINFVDHGSTGILSFPNEYLFADQLNEAFNTMHRTFKYKKVMFIRTCTNSLIFIILYVCKTNRKN